MRKTALLIILFSLLLNCGEDPGARERELLYQKLGSYPDPVKYKVISIEDASIANAKRTIIRITVPKELLVPQLGDNIRYAIRQEYEREPADAISCFAYVEGTDTAGPYTAAACDFAPFGKWERAGETRDLRKYQANIQVNNDYLTKYKRQPKEYYVDVKTKILPGRKLRINIKTDFPDGAVFDISVGRPHTLKTRGNTLYAGKIFSQQAGVKNGKIELTISVDDRKWYDTHINLQKQLGKSEMPDISRIQKDAKLRVLFTPKAKQPIKVIHILGKNGEYMTGKGIKNFGNFFFYEFEKMVAIPFKK